MNSALDHVEDLTKKIASLTGKKHEHLVKLWLLSSPKDREELVSMLELKYRQLTNNSEELWLEPIPEEQARGEITIGNVLSHTKELYPFCIPASSLIRSVTIFGQSGSGKTNLAYVILTQLLEKNIPFLVFDWKRNYRDLLALTKNNITVYTVGRGIRPFQINPLIPPPGTSPEVWLKKITEVIAGAYYVGEGVMSILHRGIDEVYKLFGVYDGTVQAWPTLDDVKNWIDHYVQTASMKELKAQWIASTNRTLQSLCYGETGRILNIDQPITIQELLTKPVILELDALPENDKTLIIQTLLLWIHHYRLQEPEREKLKHVILIEEAHHVLKKEELSAKETILDVVIREIRELGEGIIMIDQSPAQFSKNAIGNSATSLVFSLKDRSDVITAANFLLLDADHKQFLNLLPVGTCVVKCQDGYRKPFLVKIPHVRIPKGKVRDDDLEEKTSTSAIGGFSQICRTLEAQNKKLREVIREVKKNPGLFSFSQSENAHLNERNAERVFSKTDKVIKELEDMHVRFIKDVLQYPYSGISARYQRLQVSTKNGNRIKGDLEREGIIMMIPVSTGDAQVKLTEITSFGREIVKLILPDWKLRKAINGTEHRYWKNRIASALEKEGLHVEVEKPLNGDRVDIHAENGNKTAIEIETGKSNIKHNINKNLRAGYKQVLLVPTNKNAQRKIRKALVGHKP